jgi:hypothetical protein
MDTHGVSNGCPLVKSVGLRIRIEPELRRAFVEACQANDQSAAQVLRLFMRRFVAGRGSDEQPDLFAHTAPENASGSPAYQRNEK